MDGMLVHRRSIPSNLLGFPQQFAGTHLYSWVERGTVRVQCLAQEHNVISPARDRTQTARSGDERTNHETTAPPQRGQGSTAFLNNLSLNHKSTGRSERILTEHNFATQSCILSSPICFPPVYATSLNLFRVAPLNKVFGS